MSARQTDSGYLVAIGCGLCGSACGVPFLVLKDPIGLLIVGGCPVLAMVVYRLCREPSPKTLSPTSEPRKSFRKKVIRDRLLLAGVAFVLAPILACLLAVFSIVAVQTHPMDRFPILLTSTTLGLIAGSITAVAIAISAGLE